MKKRKLAVILSILLMFSASSAYSSDNVTAPNNSDNAMLGQLKQLQAIKASQQKQESMASQQNLQEAKSAEPANKISQPAYKAYSANYKVPPSPTEKKYKPVLLSQSSFQNVTNLNVLPDAFVDPNVITKVTFSNTDVNMIVSPEPIEDVVYSKEKGILVSYIGKNAFIKFVIRKNPDGTYSYIDQPSEIYVVTSDAVYPIIVSPQNIEGRIIRLAGGNLNKIKENNHMFAQMSYEKKLIKIIEDVYKNKIPDSWNVVHPQNPTPVTVKDNLSATLISSVDVVGSGFYLNEYKITSTVDMHISETDFLNANLVKNPSAIALTGFEVSNYNPVYLFIVARGGDSE